MAQEPLSSAAVEKMRAETPLLPVDYVAYMREIGWGQTDGGFMLYSGPVKPSSIYPQHAELSHIVLLGDDFNGYCLGFDLESARYGEISDSGEWEPFAQDTTLLKFLQEFS